MDIEDANSSDGAVTEIVDFQYHGIKEGQAHSRIYLTSEDAQNIVCESIGSMLDESDIDGPMVAGISGGGDSSILVRGVAEFLDARKVARSNLKCFTIVLDPLWRESAALRASDLCAQYGVHHDILHPEDVEELLGMSASPKEMWSTFESKYGTDSSHFFGTFLINLVGRALCKSRGADNLLVGYNREDIMAEVLFCLSNGRKPLAFPIRRTGETNVVMPVWKLPKHVLDSCYPKFSEDNFSERDDSTTDRRSAIYFLAHGMDAVAPQTSLSILTGLRQLMDATGGWEKLTQVASTPLVATSYGFTAANDEMVDLLKQFFPNWTEPVVRA
jgi:asparagine synthetase B (glutamine-hydrolysing)